MATFQVDTIEIQRAGKHLAEIAKAVTESLPQLADLKNLAAGTGDGNCAQAYLSFVEQWEYEAYASAQALLNLASNVLNAAAEYVYTEASLSDGEVTYFTLDQL